MTHSHDQRSLRESNLRRVVIQGEKSNTGLRSQPDRRRTDVHFGTRILVRPQIVAAHHGTIRHPGDPVVFAGRPKRYGTLRVIQPSHAAWRVLALILVVSILSHCSSRKL